MAMGSESKVILNNEMQKAKADFQQYRKDIGALVKELDSTVKTLLNGFKGEAADGFIEYYNKNVVAFFEAAGTFDEVLGRFDKEGDGLFDVIEKRLITGEGVDPSLGQNNRNVGQASTEN
jgi:hypothetical protein